MDAHGNQIKGCDMAPEVVEDAIKTAADAFKNIPANFDMAERERAKLIKQSFDRKYVIKRALVGLFVFACFFFFFFGQTVWENRDVLIGIIQVWWDMALHCGARLWIIYLPRVEKLHQLLPRRVFHTVV
jgi:hypothetical protein